MPIETSTPAPPVPPNGPTDWTTVVQGNQFTNLQRLGLWTGKKTGVATGSDPSKYFASVAPGSLGGGATPPTIYVVAHGWAPGYRAAVTKAGGNLLWWSAGAKSGGRWPSDWAWSPVAAPTLPINATGMLQSIVAQDPNAVVLAYSWLDDSATDSGDLNLDEVYGSEAYTHINGIRLANALLQAIAPSFWNTHTGLLRLIGHSHGSKVATVAALTLQQSGRRVAQLTILDAPESYATRKVNGANLLGFYLEQMQIENPSFDCAAGAFVDNYASCFGVSYAGSANLKNVVEVALDPTQLYSWDDYSNQHTYAAAWYGGAAVGAATWKEPPVGLAWPPPLKPYLPALNQTWPWGTQQYSQWPLQTGPTSFDTYSYSTQPLSVKKVHSQGNVQGDPSTRLIFGPNQGAYSFFRGSYTNSDFGDGYGLAIDIQWIAPQTGDYLVLVMEAPVTGDLEVLLVMDGQSAPVGRTSVAINSVAGGGGLDLYIYFLAARQIAADQVILSNFRLVEVVSSSGALRAQRQPTGAPPARPPLSAPPTPPAVPPPAAVKAPAPQAVVKAKAPGKRPAARQKAGPPKPSKRKG